jgi:hypothetical protein
MQACATATCTPSTGTGDQPSTQSCQGKRHTAGNSCNPSCWPADHAQHHGDGATKGSSLCMTHLWLELPALRPDSGQQCDRKSALCKPAWLPLAASVPLMLAVPGMLRHQPVLQARDCWHRDRGWL